MDEFVTVALNQHSGLFGPNATLADRLDRDGAGEVLRLASVRARRAVWALYRVRRLFWAPAQAWRSVQQVRRGDQLAIQSALAELADRLSLPLSSKAGHSRLWLAHRSAGVYPTLEAFYVAAPPTLWTSSGPSSTPVGTATPPSACSPWRHGLRTCSPPPEP